MNQYSCYYYKCDGCPQLGDAKNQQGIDYSFVWIFFTIDTPAQLWDLIHLISLELFNTIYVKNDQPHQVLTNVLLP